MKLIKYLPLVALVAMPTLGLAQDTTEAAEEVAAVAVTAEMVWIMNTLLFLIGGFLVFFMACGFAMLEGGLVRSKNVTMQMTKNIGLFSLATIAYWVIGYNLMYPLGDWAIEGYFSGLFPAPAVLEAVGIDLAGADDGEYASTGSDTMDAVAAQNINWKK